MFTESKKSLLVYYLAPISIMTNSFTIAVSDKIIQQAPALFNASLTDIFTELLQNSRRAGAQSVKITMEKRNETDWIIFQDDGIGFFSNGVEIILGGSGWEESIQKSEYPAGMGIFSLANRGCHMDANHKHIELEQDHFTGSKPVKITESNYAQGTMIAFPLLDTDLRFTSIETIIIESTQYYPIPVSFQGHILPLRSFLENAVHVEEWKGLEIGVCEYRGHKINFYGLTICTKLPTLVGCFDGSSIINLYISINVKNCPHLRLTLPSRKEVVHNEFFDQLNDQCLEVMYRYLQQLGTHYLNFADYSDALQKEIMLPPAKAQLLSFEPQIADTEHFASYNLLTLEGQKQYWLVELRETPAIEQAFFRAFKRAHPGIILLTFNENMVGYDWYDALPKITEATITVNYGDTKYPLSEIPSDIVEQRPTSIAMTLVVDNLKDKPQIDTIPLDVALWDCEGGMYYDDLSSFEIFIPKSSTISVDAIVTLMIDSFFVYCDDGDADSYDTQREYFRTEAEFQIMNIVNKAKAIESRIENYVSQHISWLVSSGKKCTITIDKTNMSTPANISVNISDTKS